jgi:hypothetical protein
VVFLTSNELYLGAGAAKIKKSLKIGNVRPSQNLLTAYAVTFISMPLNSTAQEAAVVGSAKYQRIES